jgi:hypothetical protein
VPRHRGRKVCGQLWCAVTVPISDSCAQKAAPPGRRSVQEPHTRLLEINVRAINEVMSVRQRVF